MKIALIGYGKMGKLCEQIAVSRGHTITGIATSSTDAPALERIIANADMLIDFSHPECAVDNILTAAKHKKNIVVGTTGWYDQLPKITAAVESSKIGCLYSPNFSTGVALFNTLISHAASLFTEQHGYDAAALEIHHNKKLDAPSGTAKTLAATIEKERGDHAQRVPITSVRIGTVPGTHTILFNSPNDTITLTHTAHSRTAWAEGAINAAEWMQHRSGLFTFHDLFTHKLKELLCTH